MNKKEYHKEWVKKHPFYYLNYERNRRQENREKFNNYHRVYRTLHKDKVNARKKIFIALRNKSIEKKPCIKCGKTLVEAHHEDYSKPLEIIWLCKKHHIEVGYK